MRKKYTPPSERIKRQHHLLTVTVQIAPGLEAPVILETVDSKTVRIVMDSKLRNLEAIYPGLTRQLIMIEARHLGEQIMVRLQNILPPI